MPDDSTSRKTNQQVMVYGAYGYTGELICDELVRRGHEPLLSGRNAEKLEEMAEDRGLRHCVVDLGDPKALAASLSDIEVVVHCAGPFSATFAPMIDVCLQTGTHYLDITGEWRIFEAAAQTDSLARERNLLVMPGVGFDVVPSDCLAAHLVGRLPDANHLSLAFHAIGRPSRGTARTAAEGADGRGWVRRDGVLRSVPAAWRTRKIDFGPEPGQGERLAVTIPWGDIVTAWYTTSIPNIEVYMAASSPMVSSMKRSRWLGRLLQTSFAQKRMRAKIDRRAPGPSAEQRANGKSLLWGEATSRQGERVVSRVAGPEGYSLTAATAGLITDRVLGGDWTAGFHTPAGLYGADLILEIDGVERRDEEPSDPESTV